MGLAMAGKLPPEFLNDILLHTIAESSLGKKLRTSRTPDPKYRSVRKILNITGKSHKLIAMKINWFTTYTGHSIHGIYFIS